ncbi:uncharacterized protein JCM15063_004874 [Sporobolomyces koalae]|uniref:uncharacterized protein n=1 Tax=Sporobolomyces koalae TaxID=500713 RepID=UPI0031813C0D
MSYTPLLVGATAGAFGWTVRTKDGWTDWWSGWAIAAALCFLAYLTNPNPTSFRTHVTSLSFHTHLQRLSSATPTRSTSSVSNNAPTASGSNSSAATLTTGTQNQKRKAGAKNPPASGNGLSPKDSLKGSSHVLSFSNRISLAIRTPSYKFTSYHLFSTVYVPSTRSETSTTTPALPFPRRPSPATSVAPFRNTELNALLGLGGELWLGVFGRWYALKWWEGEEIEQEERRGRLEQGVREMNVQDDAKDPRAASSSTPHVSSPLTQTARNSLPASPRGGADSSTPPQSPSSASSSNPTSRSVSVSKRIFRAGQRRSSPTSLTRLKNKAETAARERDEAERINLESNSVTTGGPGNARPESNLAPPVNYESLLSRDPSGAPPDPVLVELQLQLEELRSQTTESEKRLQEELEVLRGKKKDEDAFRAELKMKTKGLEEAKRAADLSRTEAEKELNERKSVVKDVQKRVERLRAEISKLEKKELEQVERKEKKKRERKEREKKLAEDVVKKKEELKEREKGLEEVSQKVNEMEKKLDVRRALLATRRGELAQLAGIVAARNGLGGPPPMYAAPAPPMPPQPTTATFGGVGAVANAFAVPFGHGAYGRRNYPYVHPLSATSSRPTSIRSGHYDPHTGTFQSAPSSPTLSHPVSPLDDPSLYAQNAAQADQDGGWPSSYPVATSASSASTLPQTGFLEHRLQHRATISEDGPAHFSPFDLDSANVPSKQGDDKPRALALPMQYLDSGLLAGSQSPGADGPLSPMTPHQTSLIPTQLFNMLDDDDNDDFVMPDSPTLRSHFGSMSDWQGLGLDVPRMTNAAVSGTRRSSAEEESKEELPAVKEEMQEDEFHEAQEGAEVETAADPGERSQSSLVTLRPDLFSVKGTYSATTSPLSPPPGSTFGPWDNTTPSSSPAIASMPPPAFESVGVIGSNILHRLSPSQDYTDDLPRAGLSLNPDAKAFAFPFLQQHYRTASVPSPVVAPSIVGTGSVRNGRSSSTVTSSSGANGGTSPALPSPTTAAYPFPISPPAKSRMEFANSTTGPLSARFTPPFDWPRSTSSPKVSAASTPSGSPVAASNGANGGNGNTGFNPFDEEDSLLGPLKQ